MTFLLFLVFFLSNIMRGAAFRIVCLHGSGGNGPSFEARLQPLIQQLEAGGRRCEWVFPTAPFQLNGNEPGFAWWRMAPYERSFNATELIGSPQSLAMVEDLYPFDCIIGHSQGAMLGAVVVARGLSGETQVLPSRGIFSGAAIPAPFRPLLQSLSLRYTPTQEEIPGISASASARAPGSASVSASGANSALPPPAFQSIHCIGAIDSIAPIELAALLAENLQGEVHMHSGGHTLPLDDQSLAKMVAFLC
jgi:hypothetical protein